MTEERDVARSHEEELFAKLTDQTEDLEALQESYVSLTDRSAPCVGLLTRAAQKASILQLKRQDVVITRAAIPWVGAQQQFLGQP